MVKFRYVFYFFLLTLFCCKKPFDLPASSTKSSYLVVEGVINSGSGPTVIKLSKTVQLNNKITANPVLGATVTVEGEQNSVYTLIDFNNNGNYESGDLNLPGNQKYRLSVKTSDGRQYLSDFVPVKPTPPIDSIGYTVKNKIVQLYANAHDPANNTRYYRWDYDETWEFHSRWASAWVYDSLSNAIVARTPAQQVYFCFGNDRSTNILLGSTANLSSDVVFQAPITSIPLTSEKVMSKYSILVRQYAISVEAYQFYQKLAKNTEQLGSIFDAQPTELKGNIHSVTDPNEPVIGFLSITNIQSKRIFIPVQALTTELLTIYPYDCEQDTAAYDNGHHINTVLTELLSQPITHIPTSALGSNLPPTGFLYSSPLCVDCTLRGTTQTPDFWR